MKSERHHGILKRLSRSGSVKVSDLSNSPNVTKETIRSGLNELARLGYLTRCHGGAFIVLDSLDTVAKNGIAYALENYDTAQGIKEDHSTMKSQVCVIGPSSVSITSYLPRLPTIGESLLASNFIFSPRGKGCNQVLVVSFADTNVYFITKVDIDHFSDHVIDSMNLFRTYKSIIYQAKETRAGTATILANEGTGDNVTATYPDANMIMSSGRITIQKEATISSDIILL